MLPATPGKCGGPLKISDITRNSCHLSWRPPAYVTGSKIKSYVVERKLTSKDYWTTISSFGKVYLSFRLFCMVFCISISHTFQETEIQVQGLYEDQEYEFRVAAINENGTGTWLNGDAPIIAKMPFGWISQL